MQKESTENKEEQISPSQANKQYRLARKNLAFAVVEAERVSRGGSRIRSETAQHYWASVLFTRIVVTAKSVQVLAPVLDPNAHWDFSAVASIVRNLAECYLFYYFLCIDNVSSVEKDARIILLNLHDYASREKLFSELNEIDSEETTKQKKEVHDDLTSKFIKNSFLANLSEKRQRELIKGEKTPFVQDEIIDRTSLDKTEFRFLYRLFSNHTHTGPVAFYRMAEHARGYGFPNTTDTVFKAIALAYAAKLIKQATIDFLTFFPEADARGLTMEKAETSKKVASTRKTNNRKKQ